MNRYEFENLISDYLEGELSFSKRKEFELYLEDNVDASSLYLKIRDTISDMKKVDKISISEDFNSKLLSKIKDETSMIPNHKKNIFGLSPLYVSIFSSLSIAVIMIGYSLVFSGSNSTSNIDYSSVLIDKSQKPVNSQIVKNNTSFTANDKSDSLDVNEEGYKPKKKNKIKFVNY